MRPVPSVPVVADMSIALGVGVIVAIQLANASSLAGFERAVDSVSGRASLQVLGTGLGVDERRLLDLGWLREYGAVSPVVEGDVTVPKLVIEDGAVLRGKVDTGAKRA